jgi:hypothetical protein
MGLEPRIKKNDAVLKMQPPASLKQLHGFIGIVNYYKDMRPHRSHILEPLTAKTGAPRKDVKAPLYTWTKDMQKSFHQLKASVAAEVLCTYPDHNKPFKICTDASNYQLGACIMQEDCPISHNSRNLNSAQNDYSTIDKEILCVVAAAKNPVQCNLVPNCT